MASAAPSTAWFVGALLAGTLAWIAVDFGASAPAGLLRYGSGPERGPWGEHTAPIDWCEANYAVHGHVAEFWNVLSCAAYLVAAAPHARSDESWLRVFAVLVALTGLTSALFHATLWWSGQKLDEFFENAAVIALLHASAVRRPLARTFVHACAVGALVCLVPVAAAELWDLSLDRSRIPIGGSLRLLVLYVGVRGASARRPMDHTGRRRRPRAATGGAAATGGIVQTRGPATGGGPGRSC